MASSEGESLNRIGRHDWAEAMGLWNMGRRGFEELYHQLPPPKPGFEEVWRLTGGNPRLLSRLYAAGWNQHRVVEAMARVRGLRELVAQLTPRQRRLLAAALEDPDSLSEAASSASDRERMEARRLLDLLVKANLVMRLWDSGYGWVDEPPPRSDQELRWARPWHGRHPYTVRLLDWL